MRIRQHRRLICGAVGVAAAAVLAFWLLPVVTFNTPHSTLLLDRHGDLLGATVAADEQWRFPPTRELPDRFATAVMRFEDRRFELHPGVDPLAIARAAWQNTRSGRVESGGSTLTMQVVRMARGNQPRTVTQKAIEAVLAFRLEAAASKQEILRTWASNAPFGGNTVGLDAAAWRYFGRPPEALSWAETATLAVLPNAPSLMHPGRNREALRGKRDRLLSSLYQAGSLEEADLRLALSEPLPLEPMPLPRLAPHLLSRTTPGTRLQTTLEAGLQQRASTVVDRHHDRLSGNQIHNAAALIASVGTGEILAWVGNATASAEGGYVDIVEAERSPGSLLKPFLHGALLEAGELLPQELLADVPMRLGGFAPENFDRSYDGAVRADRALARSRNIPAVSLLRRYGLGRFKQRLEQLGMTTLSQPADHYGLSLILGGSEATLLELAGLYRGLAWSVINAEEPESRPPRLRFSGIPQPGPSGLAPGAAWLTLEALLDVQRPGVHASWTSLAGGQRIAWKTGTSFGFRDGWAIGVTPQHVVAVWVGNASGEGRPELTGFQAAAPILFELFGLLPAGTWFDQPIGDVETARVCSHSGQRAGQDCAETVEGLIPRAGLRAPPCGFCERIHCNEDCSERMHSGCASVAELRSQPWFVLPPTMEGLYQRRSARYRPLPPWREGCAPNEEAMALVSPRSGARVLIPVDLDGTQSEVVFEATHRDDSAVIHWHLDATYLGSTTGIHQVQAQPIPGRHVLVLVDGEGRRTEHEIHVLADG